MERLEVARVDQLGHRPRSEPEKGDSPGEGLADVLEEGDLCGAGAGAACGTAREAVSSSGATPKTPPTRPGGR